MMELKRIVSLMLTVTMLCLLLPSFAGAAQVNAAPLTRASNAQDGMVRVFLSSMGNVSSLNLTITGSYTAQGNTSVTLYDGDRVSISFNNANGHMTMSRSGVSYDMGREMHFRRHQTNGESGLRIAQAKLPDNLYPGDLQLIAQSYGGAYRLYPIMHVYIEYYLNGVLPYEMGNSAPLEALKAQAVAARTYTLNKMNTRASSLYDVVDTTNDQVYYGNSDSTTRCTEAVSATKGIVLMNGGKLTGTYYTASNGGQTESAYNMWGSSGYEYLTIKDDPFDLMNTSAVFRKVTVYADNSASGQKSALKTLLQAKLESTLISMGYSATGANVTAIKGITPHTPKHASPSRLYTKLDFDVEAYTRSGSMRLTLTFDIFSELETVLGMSINASNNEIWSVERGSGTFTLYARRYGHGVGMSQRGAMQMGSLGYTYDQILGFYYENCTRVQYTFTHTIMSSLASGGTDTVITTEKPAEITGSGNITALVKLVGVADKLAVRDAADYRATVVTSIINGGLVNVIARMGTWTMIRLGSIVGYVPTSALRFNGTPPEATNETPTKISQWATVNCNGTLNLRSIAGLNGSVISAIPSGSILCVFGVQGSWANVQYGALTGWASTDFLKLTSSYPGEVTGVSDGSAVVTIPSGSGTVNLREAASTSARVLATLSNGTQVTVTSNDGSWCAVTTSAGLRGYIMASFLAYDGSGDNDASADDEPVAPDLSSGEVEAIIHTTSTGLNLRAQPSTSSAVLASMPRGESVIVTSRGSEWCAVRYGTINGYAATQYLKFPADEGAGGAVIAYGVVDTQVGSLNMRKLPSLGSTVLLTIPDNERIGILQKLDGWCKVTYAGVNGYVMTSYLSMEDSGAGNGSVAIVTTPSGTLNLRETPSASARVLTTINPGVQVTLLSQGNEWCEISYGTHTGYVMTKFLIISGVPTPVVTPVPVVTPSPQTKTVKVSTGSGGLNLRETADANARVLTIIPDGAVLECLAEGSTWTQVRYGNQKGYVMTRYLAGANQSGGHDETVNLNLPATVKTGNGGLNMRETASTSAAVLIVIPDGAQVTVINKDDTWSHIRYDDAVGYVMTKYLSFGQKDTAGKSAWIRADAVGGVNMRFMPDLSGQVLAVLQPGQEILVTLEGAEWSVVRAGDKAGYVMSRYITFTTPGQAMPDTGAVYDETMYDLSGWEAVVTDVDVSLNLRSWCATTAPVLTTIPKGATVRLTQYGDTWCHVVYGEVDGYCMTKYLSPREME